MQTMTPEQAALYIQQHRDHQAVAAMLLALKESIDNQTAYIAAAALKATDAELRALAGGLEALIQQRDAYDRLMHPETAPTSKIASNPKT